MSSDVENLPRQPMPPANILLVGILALLTGILAWQVWDGNNSGSIGPNGTYTPREITPKGELAPAEETTISVFHQTSPSVVFIRTKGFQPYLTGQPKEKELSSGTGFVWDKEGHIVTNLHVVKEALRSTDSALEVQFVDQTVVDAEIIGGVHEYDIAILKVRTEASRLTPIRLGTSDDLLVGQWVMAIGNPFGFDHTLSTGVIGGLNRSVATEDGRGILAGLIQTDAAINPGNSGGPLLDSSGRMIGVNTAIVSPTGAYSGLGFAVPVTSVVSSVEMVLAESTSNPRPILGVTILAPEHARLLRIPEEEISRGLFIKQIEPGSPAAQAGLIPIRQRGYTIYLGDQIASVDGVPVTSLDELQSVLAGHRPGDVVTLQIYRGTTRGEVEVTLEARKLLFW